MSLLAQGALAENIEKRIHMPTSRVRKPCFAEQIFRMRMFKFSVVEVDGRTKYIVNVEEDGGYELEKSRKDTVTTMLKPPWITRVAV